MSSKTCTFKNSIFKNLHFQKLNFQKLALSKTQFSKTCTFKNSIFKNSYFSKLVLFIAFRAFSKLPCFLKIPRSKFISNSPQKFRVFKKIPRSGKVDFLQIPCFFQKIPCFTKFPGFQIFKSLKNTRKNHLFLYKNIYLQVKSIYLQIKNIYKRQGFILCIIFTVFSSFLVLLKKLYVSICFLRYFNTL